jgi:hypothetical protein
MMVSLHYCRCYSPPFRQNDFLSTPLGIDKTNGRFGEVSVETCAHCGKTWLRYVVEYEAFTASGRWFRGPISQAEIAGLSPEEAVPFLERLSWHFKGGDYFSSSGQRCSGAVRADQ